MALKLTLKAGERVAVNGAVIVNGDRRSTLVIENRASVLREKDILQPEAADTPAKRIYFSVMLLYLSPDNRAANLKTCRSRLSEFVGAVSTPDALRECARLAAHVANDDFYKALASARRLIEFEKSRLADVA